jgi:hypothetical protein
MGKRKRIERLRKMLVDALVALFCSAAAAQSYKEGASRFCKE